MPRPKLHRYSLELDEEIARIQRESRAEIERLRKARVEAEAAEDHRRGELVRVYLAGRHGDDLRTVLNVIVAPKDRLLFGLSTVGVERQDVAHAS